MPKKSISRKKNFRNWCLLTILEYNDDAFGIQNVLKHSDVVNGVCFGQESVKKNLSVNESVNTSRMKAIGWNIK